MSPEELLLLRTVNKYRYVRLCLFRMPFQYTTHSPSLSNEEVRILSPGGGGEKSRPKCLFSVYFTALHVFHTTINRLLYKLFILGRDRYIQGRVTGIQIRILLYSFRQNPGLELTAPPLVTQDLRGVYFRFYRFILCFRWKGVKAKKKNVKISHICAWKRYRFPHPRRTTNQHATHVIRVQTSKCLFV